MIDFFKKIIAGDNHLKKNEIKQQKIRLVAIAKDEASYLSMWIHHHLYFGFDEIEIYVNNTSDNSERLLEKIGKMEPVKCVMADYMYEDPDCTMFQKFAYKKAYEKAVEENISHLMFLDIDEYWTPLDFKSSINDCLGELVSADIISFEWVFKRNEERPFGNIYSHTNSVNKNHLVKSIFKTSLDINDLDVHNVRSKGALNLLANGEPHPKPFTFSVDDYNINYTPIKNYFVLHRFWRSDLEYIYLLGQGMKAFVSDSKGVEFKSNRQGYLMPENRITTLDLDKNLVDAHLDDYRKFIDKYDIKSEIDEAQAFVINKSELTLQKIKKNLPNKDIDNLLVNLDINKLERKINHFREKLSSKFTD